MTPQNTLPGVSTVLGQQSKAMGSEEKGLRLHQRMSQASSQLTAWQAGELLGLGCCGLTQKQFPAGLYSAFMFSIQLAYPSGCASRKCLSSPALKEEKTKFPKLLLKPSTLSPQSLLTISAFHQGKIQSEVWVLILYGETFFTGQRLGGLSISQQHGMWKRGGVTRKPETSSCSSITAHPFEVRIGEKVGKKHSAAGHFGGQDSKAKKIMLSFLQRTSQSTTRPLEIDALWIYDYLFCPLCN